MDNQNKPEPQIQQPKAEIIPAQNQPPQQSQQQNQRKKTYRRYYNNRKKFRPSSGEPNQPQQQVQNFSFKKISIVVPFLNEEESLRPLYNEIKKTLRGISSDYEIIFVDDGSSDKSLNVIKELARNDNKIHYYSFRTNYGKSAALQVAFKHVTGDAVITLDADLQDDPAEIPNLLKKLEEGYDLVSGWKKKRYDPIIKKFSLPKGSFSSRLLLRLVSIFFALFVMQSSN